jgi:hypothetical protein
VTLCNCEQPTPGIRFYTHKIVQPHRPAVRTAAGNAEERSAQIQRIKERLDRLGGTAYRLAADLEVLGREIRTLTASEDAPNYAVFPSRKQHN